MASFVRQTISMYRGGFDSRRMLLTVRPSLHSYFSSATPREAPPHRGGFAGEALGAAVCKCGDLMCGRVTEREQGWIVCASECNWQSCGLMVGSCACSKALQMPRWNLGACLQGQSTCSRTLA